MRKVTLIFSIITLVALFALNLRAENKSPKLIVVKPPASKTSDEPQNADAAPTLDGQFAAPSPRDQLYIFWLFGKIISYPIDQVESYVSKKWNSLEKLQIIPAAAPASGGSVVNPFDSINRREIPPAPPVQLPNLRGR